MSYAQDGVLTKYTAEDIADAVQWERGADELMESLLGSGFLDREEADIFIHDWFDYSGNIIDVRERNKEKMRAARAKHNPTRVEHNPTRVGLEKRREEKRREENKEISSSCAEPETGSTLEVDFEELESNVAESENVIEEINDPVVIELPLNTGKPYAIRKSLVDEVKDLYPAVDVMQELRGMKGWLIGNPTKRKTKTGIKKFITAWLSKRQNQGGSIKNKASTKDYIPTDEDYNTSFFKGGEDYG